MEGTRTAQAEYGTRKIPGESNPPAVEVAPIQRSFISNIPIRYRLPLLIGVTLAVIIGVSTWAGYRSVKQAAVAVGQERLKNLTDQLASLSQQSTATLLTKTLAAANDAAVVDFLTAPSETTQESAGRLLEQFDSSRDVSAVCVELRSLDGAVLYSAPQNATIAAADIKSELVQATNEPNRDVGPIRVIGDLVVYPAVAAAKDTSGKVVGYLVRWRKIAATPQAKQQLADLLGSQAALYLGNARGDILTDLTSVVPTPPTGLQATLQFVHYSRNGNNVMALGRPIGGTPWFLLVEFPEQVFLTQASRFLWRTVGVGAVVFVLGLVSAFLISESIVRPIRSFTDSAVAISGGDYSRTVNIKQQDELGVLADSFNEMVVKVRNSQHDLEQKVQERTAQLEIANQELEAFSHLTSRDLQHKSDELTAMTQQLWQASKLATMGELTASIAHELNNPLATVALHVESLIQQMPKDDPKRRSLEVILNETERMATLVNDLLPFSHRSYRQLSTVDVREEITNTIEFIRYFLKNRKIEVILEFDQELPTIQADRQQLRQMFLNLMTNASDAMPDGGKLTIRVVVSSLNNGQAVLMEFIDTGEGMTQEQAARVWEPFFTTKPAGKGTGLGLAICRRLTEEHGGRINLITEAGKGTVVSIVIPATANGSESTAAQDLVAVLE